MFCCIKTIHHDSDCCTSAMLRVASRGTLTCPFILVSGLIFCLGTYPLFTRIVILQVKVVDGEM